MVKRAKATADLILLLWKPNQNCQYWIVVVKMRNSIPQCLILLLILVGSARSELEGS